MRMPMPNLSGNCTDNMIGSEVATAIIDGDFPVACCYQDNAIKIKSVDRTPSDAFPYLFQPDDVDQQFIAIFLCVEFP